MTWGSEKPAGPPPGRFSVVVTFSVLPIGASSPKYLRATERVSTSPSGAPSAATGSPASTGMGISLKKSGSAQAIGSMASMSPRRTPTVCISSRATCSTWGKFRRTVPAIMLGTESEGAAGRPGRVRTSSSR